MHRFLIVLRCRCGIAAGMPEMRGVRDLGVGWFDSPIAARQLAQWQSTRLWMWGSIPRRIIASGCHGWLFMVNGGNSGALYGTLGLPQFVCGRHRRSGYAVRGYRMPPSTPL